MGLQGVLLESHFKLNVAASTPLIFNEFAALSPLLVPALKVFAPALKAIILKPIVLPLVLTEGTYG